MKKNVALITGASGGIGKALVEKYLEQGYALALVDIHFQQLQEAIPSMFEGHADYLLFEGDVSSLSFLQEVVSRCLGQWGRIDVLVNNAAWRKIESLQECSLQDWNKTFAINVTAPAFLAKLIAQELMKLKQHCVFINLSSVMSELASGYASAYTVCKGAIESLTYELATLYGPFGFRAVTIRPASVDTALSKDYLDENQQNISRDLQEDIDDRTPLGRAAKPSEIAEAVFWIGSPLASYITSTTLSMDGGLGHNFNSYALKKRLKPGQF